MSRIPSADIEDVPAILMYVMEQVGSKTGAEVCMWISNFGLAPGLSASPVHPQLISEVRDKLDTKSCFFHLELGPPVASSTPLPRSCKQLSPSLSQFIL